MTHVTRFFVCRYYYRPTLHTFVFASSFYIVVRVDRNFLEIYIPLRTITGDNRTMSQLCLSYAPRHTRAAFGSHVSVARSHSYFRSLVYIRECMRKLPLLVVFCRRAADKERISTFSYPAQCIDGCNDRPTVLFPRFFFQNDLITSILLSNSRDMNE